MSNSLGRIEVLGVPMDLGAGLRGVDVGPSAMRHAGLIPRLRQLGYDVVDGGNLPIQIAAEVPVGNPAARYSEVVDEVCRTVRSRVSSALNGGATPIILGGDHSLSAGSLAGVLDVRPETKVLWLDAHPDLNTPATSPSGNIHGMPLALALGQAPDLLADLGWDGRRLKSERLAIVGLRSTDPGERALIRRLGICVYTVADVDRYGMYEVMQRVLDRLNPQAGQLHVSLDLDVVDPYAAPGVGTPVAGGITIREAHLALEMVAQTGILGSIEAVEVNSFRDHENQTGRLATDLVLSAFGQTIL
ncbi:MAG TPA: arginase [Chloroflexota bacterium]|nr:arginase [Chloroflexota bacterium]